MIIVNKTIDNNQQETKTRPIHNNIHEEIEMSTDIDPVCTYTEEALHWKYEEQSCRTVCTNYIASVTVREKKKKKKKKDFQILSTAKACETNTSRHEWK